MRVQAGVEREVRAQEVDEREARVQEALLRVLIGRRADEKERTARETFEMETRVQNVE